MNKILILFITFASFSMQAQIVHTDTTLTIDDVSYEEVDDLRIVDQYVRDRNNRRTLYRSYNVRFLPAGYTAAIQTRNNSRSNWSTITSRNCGFGGCYDSGPIESSDRFDVELRYTNNFQRYSSRVIMRNEDNEVVYRRD